MGRLLLALTLAALAATAQQPSQSILGDAIKLHQSGDLQAAIRLYQQYLQSGPPSLDAFTNYGAALAHEGQYSEAIAEYKEALKIQANHPPALLNLALAYYKIGRDFEA